MGSNSSCNTFTQLMQNQDKRALLLGLDAAGKTTILYTLKLEPQTTIPTIGFNIDTVQVGKFNLSCWDVGGSSKMRTLWKHYYPDTHFVIFVVDSSDKGRILDARDELHKILNHELLHQVSLLVLANKQDLPNAMAVAQLIEALELQKVQQKWYIQGCCATNGQGLIEGFEQLVLLP